MTSEFPLDSPKRSVITAQDAKDPILSNLRIKVVKATQIGTVIKPRPKEQQTTVQSRKVNYDIIRVQVLRWILVY